MARKVRNSLLESRSARLKLKVRRKPYTGPSLARGVMLLYRRNRTNGTWVVKASNGPVPIGPGRLPMPTTTTTATATRC
jgi:hypothetical protein